MTNKIKVIPNAIRYEKYHDTKLKKWDGIENLIIIGYFGGHPFDRGGKFVIDLVEILNKENIKALGVIGGDHKMDRHEIQMKLKCLKDIKILGLQTPDQVVKELKNIHVGIALDESSRNNRVGNSYQKVSQYIASGCMVITNNKVSDDLKTLSTVRTVQNADLSVAQQFVTDILERNPTDNLNNLRTSQNFIKETRCCKKLNEIRFC